MQWHDLLPQLLATGDYRTQGDLVRALADAGHDVNQATVSRQLAWLGARKVDGVYRLQESPLAAAPVHTFRITAHGCLAVVKTDPAFAMVLAQAIDDAEIAGVLGTVAGDDTVFVATEGRPATDRLAHALGLGRHAPLEAAR
jgi:transcriptional regulator of arginine metabolism